jgi:O-antigen/teichoic acid export membrane protein
VWSLVLASGSLARLGDFGLGGGVTRFVAADLGANRGERAAKTVGMSAIAIGILVGLCCLVAQPGLRAGLGKLISDPALLASARSLVPWALSALWLGAVAQVFLGALDGCQRGAARAAINVISSTMQLVAAYVIVPAWGLDGLGLVQLVQAGSAAILGVACLGAALRYPIGKWLTPDRPRFLEIIRFGGGIQLNALAQILFDPTVKVLLASLGDLSLTGYYEAANRAAMQFRSIIVSAYQMLVPYVAYRVGAGGLSRDRVAFVYRSGHALMMVIAIPYFSVVACGLPFILSAWIGRADPKFVTIGLICLAGWAANTLLASAYLLYVALGRLRWTIGSHLAIGTLNLLFGFVGGWRFGGIGVVGGAMIALAMGSAVAPLAFHREYRIPAGDLFPRDSVPLIATSLLGAAVLLAAQLRWAGFSHVSPGGLGALATYACLCVVLIWRNPIVVRSIRRFEAAPV